ncbi:alkyl hydroperoxide reductase subunit F [Dermatophilus congolensis]|uniref:alkyl hydroperoxide reductase subunit F n=1 Tax=Dermatophilus congolensis TaxID=1863 RepID=UPI001AAF0897
MSVLDSTLTASLKQYLEMLEQPIELVATLDDRPKSGEMKDLLNEIAALSDKVTARFDGTDARTPSFDVVRTGTDVSVTFAGLPMGHEFTSLVLALLQVGGRAPKEDEALLNAIAALEGDYEFTTYMSLTCQNCPTVVQALNMMSVVNPRIRHTAVEGSLFQDEIQEKNIMAVPAVYLNGELFDQGRMEAAEILAKIDAEGAAQRSAEALGKVDPVDVLVVGGGPAGVAASIYAARKGIPTALVADRLGGQVNDTMAIENLISVPYTEGPKLSGDLQEHMKQYDVTVVKNQQATKLLPAGEDGYVTVEFGDASLKGKTVILATGARWRKMGIPGEDDYRNKGVSNCPHCDGPLFKGKRIAVVGGGNSGVEAAIDLAGVVEHVTLFEFLPEMKADEVLQRKLRSLENVDIILNARTSEVLGDGTSVTGLDYEDRATGEIKHVDLQGIFVQIGLLPNTEWLGEAVQMSGRKEIVIDEHGATNVPGVFAAGDCTVAPYKQIVTAFGAGATAALGAFDHLIRTSAPAEA